MRVHHLDCGSLCPRGGHRLLGEGAQLACHCLLLELPDSLALVETGLGTRDVQDPKRLGALFRALVRPRLSMEETALARVRALGFDPRDVRDVLITHLDLDHAGGLSDFPWARLHVLGDEWRAAQNPPRRERSRYRAVHWEHSPEVHEYTPEGEDFHGFAVARELDGLPPEIVLVSLPGHSRGHAGIAIDEGDQTLLHCGDAYFHHAEMSLADHPQRPWGLGVFQRAVAHDDALRRDTQARLREALHAAGPKLRTTSAHDRSELRREQARG
ncbi:MAG: MBL fold metallo-hydrolase [Deltaproteobacteria bacterium]|nr:MBL fold metallo-hydrolase [Deltaproteobacteria bacterium]